MSENIKESIREKLNNLRERICKEYRLPKSILSKLKQVTGYSNIKDFKNYFEWSDDEIEDVIDKGRRAGISKRDLKQFIRSSGMDFSEDDIDMFF